MDRENFFKMFSRLDITSLYGIYNDILSAADSKNPICSKNFLTPDIWAAIIENKVKLGLDVRSLGIFEEAERRVLIFNSDEDFGVDLIKIENRNKFVSLLHKDYLGGVLSLGIKREKLGDFMLKDNICYFPCKKDISEYLLSNIKTIGKTKVSVSLVNNIYSDLISIEYQDLVIEVPSLRLDAVVSEITKLSRSEAVNLIKRGLVLYNYSEISDKSKTADLGRAITIRGYGKYKLEDEIGKTKKGNIKIYIKKYK
jgi:RNA-binding protein YlmH